jgi:hypothetical protein
MVGSAHPTAAANLRGCLKRVVLGLICHQETAKTLIFEDISLRGCLKRVVPGLICHQETAETLIFEDISLRPRYNLRRSLTFQTPSKT